MYTVAFKYKWSVWKLKMGFTLYVFTVATCSCLYNFKYILSWNEIGNKLLKINVTNLLQLKPAILDFLFEKKTVITLSRCEVLFRFLEFLPPSSRLCVYACVCVCYVCCLVVLLDISFARQIFINWDCMGSIFLSPLRIYTCIYSK